MHIFPILKIENQCIHNWKRKFSKNKCVTGWCNKLIFSLKHILPCKKKENMLYWYLDDIGPKVDNQTTLVTTLGNRICNTLT